MNGIPIYVRSNFWLERGKRNEKSLSTGKRQELNIGDIGFLGRFLWGFYYEQKRDIPFGYCNGDFSIFILDSPFNISMNYGSLFVGPPVLKVKPVKMIHYYSSQMLHCLLFVKAFKTKVNYFGNGRSTLQRCCAHSLLLGCW
jgi:hypothetical protein